MFGYYVDIYDMVLSVLTLLALSLFIVDKIVSLTEKGRNYVAYEQRKTELVERVHEWLDRIEETEK